MAAAFTGASNEQVFHGHFPPYMDSEAVTLTGGAGADWTPTKGPQTRALMIGVAGNLKVDTAAGSTGVVIPVQAGELRISVTKVYNTTDGKTASNIAAMY